MRSFANSLVKNMLEDNDHVTWSIDQQRAYHMSSELSFQYMAERVFKGKKYEVPDLSYEQNYADIFVPSNSSAGFYIGVTPTNPTKSDVHSFEMARVCSVLRTAVERCDSFHNMLRMVRMVMTDVHKMSPKLESIIPDEPLGIDGVRPDKTRIFFISQLSVTVIMKAIFLVISKAMGVGTPDNFIPVGINMKFLHGSATAFFCEMFNVDAKELGTFRSVQELEMLENKILDEYVIVESDFSRYDMHLDAKVLGECMMPYIQLFDLPGVEYDAVKGCMHFPKGWHSLDDKTKLWVVCFVRCIEVLTTKVVNAPDGSGWWRLVGCLPSGVWLTALANSIANYTMGMVIWSKYLGVSIETAYGLVRKGDLKIKTYGDDVLVVVRKNLLAAPFDSSRFTSMWKKEFNMIIKGTNTKVCSKVFVKLATGRVFRAEAPSFLKMFFTARICKHHGCEILFYRCIEQTVPKLLASAQYSLDPYLQMDRAACVAHVCGTNYETYHVVKNIHDFCAGKVIDNPMFTDYESKDDLVLKYMERAELSPDSPPHFPEFTEVLERHGCPRIGYEVNACPCESIKEAFDAYFGVGDAL